MSLNVYGILTRNVSRAPWRLFAKTDELFLGSVSHETKAYRGMFEYGREPVSACCGYRFLTSRFALVGTATPDDFVPLSLYK
jgi:hypothetical protein